MIVPARFEMTNGLRVCVDVVDICRIEELSDGTTMVTHTESEGIIGSFITSMSFTDVLAYIDRFHGEDNNEGDEWKNPW